MAARNRRVLKLPEPSATAERFLLIEVSCAKLFGPNDPKIRLQIPVSAANRRLLQLHHLSFAEWLDGVARHLGW